jgi:hypothetical protein
MCRTFNPKVAGSIPARLRIRAAGRAAQRDPPRTDLGEPATGASRLLAWRRRQAPTVRPDGAPDRRRPDRGDSRLPRSLAVRAMRPAARADVGALDTDPSLDGQLDLNPATESTAESCVAARILARRWSLYGAQRAQPVATGGKAREPRDRKNKPNPLPPAATGCLRRSMVRRRKREPGVLIAAARFLPTMLARFPRRSQGVLTNYSPTSRAATNYSPTSRAAVAQPRLQRRHVSPRRRGGRPSNEAAKRVQDFPVSVRDA